MASIFIICYHHHLGLGLALSFQNKARSVDESQDSSFVLLEREVRTTSFSYVALVALFLHCEDCHHLPVGYRGQQVHDYLDDFLVALFVKSITRPDDPRQVPHVEGIREELKDSLIGQMDVDGGLNNDPVPQDHLVPLIVFSLSFEFPQLAGFQSLDVANEQIGSVIDELFFVIELLVGQSLFF